MSTLLKIWRLYKSPLWSIARKAVNSIIENTPIQNASDIESAIAYCPRCGQVPTDDRRMEEARELCISKLGYIPKRHELDFILNWHYFRSKT